MFGGTSPKTWVNSHCKIWGFHRIMQVPLPIRPFFAEFVISFVLGKKKNCFTFVGSPQISIGTPI